MADFGISLAIGIGLQLFSALLTPPTQGPRLSSKKVPRSDYGVDIPRIRGTYPVTASMVWSPKEYREEKKKRGKIGGKSIEYRYYGDFAYLLTSGQIAGLLRLKLNGETKINYLSGKSGDIKGSGDFISRYLEIYPGTDTQTPCPTIQGVDGVANTPAYRGRSYVFLKDYPLSDSGNRPPGAEAIVCTNALQIGQTYLDGNFRPVTWTTTSGATIVNAPNDPALGRMSFASGTSVAAQTTEMLDIPNATTGLEIEFLVKGTGTYALSGIGVSAYGFELGTNLRVVEEGVERWAQSPTNAYPDGVRLNIDFHLGNIRYWVDGLKVYEGAYGGTNPLRGIALITTGTVGALITSGTLVTSDKLTPLPVNLRSLITEICAIGGVATIDVTDIPSTAQVLGLQLNPSGSPKDWLLQLQQLYYFDVFQRGRTLIFRRAARGSVVRTLTLDDLAATDLNSARPEPYEFTSPNPSELPGEVSVKYYDGRDSNLRQKTVYRRFDTSPSRQKVQLSVDAALTTAQANGIADTEIKRLWYTKGIKFRTTLDHCDLEPGDVIQLPVMGTQRRVMLTKVRLGSNFILDCEAVTQDDSITETLVTVPQFSSGAADGGGLFERRPVALLNIPRIRESDPPTLIYFGVGGERSWVSGFLNVSPDGTNWDTIAQTASVSTMGVATTVLPNGVVGIDTVSTLVVKLYSGQLDSISDDAFAVGGTTHLLLVGNEIVRFRDATLIGDSTYRLSYFDRGRNSTPMTGHTLNERVVLLSTVQPVALEPDQVGATVQAKVTFDQQTLDEAVSIPLAL